MVRYQIFFWKDKNTLLYFKFHVKQSCKSWPQLVLVVTWTWSQLDKLLYDFYFVYKVLLVIKYEYRRLNVCSRYKNEQGLMLSLTVLQYESWSKSQKKIKEECNISVFFYNSSEELPIGLRNLIGFQCWRWSKLHHFMRSTSSLCGRWGATWVKKNVETPVLRQESVSE